MLQILALWLLTERIGSIIEQKGHKTGRYKVLTVALWFGGEIIGAILGVILTSISKSAQCVIYPFALGGAAVGAGVAYLIAATLSPTSSASLSAPPSTNSTFLPIPSDLHFYENARWRLVSNILWNGLILAILMIVVLVGSISSTWFWSPANVQNITRAWLTAALLVPTMALVIASGGLDLSVGSVAGLTSVVMASLLVSARVSIGGAFIVGLCLAFLVGLVNGLLIGMIKLNAAVVTLAMMTM